MTTEQFRKSMANKLILEAYYRNLDKPRPTYNKDVLHNLFHLDVSGEIWTAFWRGKKDLLANLSPDSNPYRLPSLRDMWEAGYHCELMDMTDAIGAYHDLTNRESSGDYRSP